MINYRQVIFMGYECSWYRDFLLDPDPYQKSPWIRIRNEFFHILDPDPYQNYTDPQHCRVCSNSKDL